MSRQEAINQFNNGLLMDLHPLTTPNNVLTDCLNGTLITYNGNEFVLQNDMGNYKLSMAKLNPEYVPVGLKEYGDIIYIVSVNPIKKLVEIGSFPSQQTIFDSESEGEEQNIESYTFAINDIVNYTDLKKSIPLYIYSVADDFLLNPGDKYFLYSDDDVKQSDEYFKPTFYVINEDKKLIEIDSNLITVNTIITSPSATDFLPVKWDMPGWLSMKYCPANFDDFNIYTQNVKSKTQLIETLSDAEWNFNLNFQLITTDSQWSPELYKNVYFRIQPKSGTLKLKDGEYGAALGSLNIRNLQILNYVNNSYIIYRNQDFSWKPTTIENGIPTSVTVTITPIFEYELPDGVATIIYDQFITDITINLSDSQDISKLSIGESNYSWAINNTSATINFSVENCPNDLIAYYSLYKLDNDVSDTLVSVKSKVLFDFNAYGQNLLTIPFDTDNQEINRFDKEDIYIFDISLYSTEDEQETLEYSKKFPLITSEVFNGFIGVNNYLTISAEQWLNLAEWFTDLISIDDITPSLTLTSSTPISSLSFPKEYKINVNDNESVPNDISANINLSLNTNLKIKKKNTWPTNQFGQIGAIWANGDIQTNLTAKVSYLNQFNDITFSQFVNNTDNTYTSESNVAITEQYTFDFNAGTQYTLNDIEKEYLGKYSQLPNDKSGILVNNKYVWLTGRRDDDHCRAHILNMTITSNPAVNNSLTVKDIAEDKHGKNQFDAWINSQIFFNNRFNPVGMTFAAYSANSNGNKTTKYDDGIFQLDVGTSSETAWNQFTWRPVLRVLNSAQQITFISLYPDGWNKTSVYRASDGSINTLARMVKQVIERVYRVSNITPIYWKVITVALDVPNELINQINYNNFTINNELNSLTYNMHSLLSADGLSALRTSLNTAINKIMTEDSRHINALNEDSVNLFTINGTIDTNFSSRITEVFSKNVEYDSAYNNYITSLNDKLLEEQAKSDAVIDELSVPQENYTLNGYYYDKEIDDWGSEYSASYQKFVDALEYNENLQDTFVKSSYAQNQGGVVDVKFGWAPSSLETLSLPLYNSNKD